MSPILLAATTMGDKIDSIFYAFDYWVFSILGAIQCDFLNVVAKFFTSFGDEMFVIPIAVLGAVLCFFKKTRKYGATLLIAIGVGTLVTNLAVKPMFERVRPYNTLQIITQTHTAERAAAYKEWYIGAGGLSEGDFSFPSGHTTAAFEMATALFLCFRKDKKKIAWLFPAIAIMVMVSRVYLMVHYATDVIGGCIIGIVSGIIGFALASLIVNKIKALEKADAGKLFKKAKPKVGIALIVIFVCAILGYNFGTVLSEGGEDTLRCAYNQEYDCQNAAKVKDKYPAIDGKRYCKIHWKQLNAEQQNQNK